MEIADDPQLGPVSLEARLRIEVNGEPMNTDATTILALLDELGYAGVRVATALNSAFVPAGNRGGAMLCDGDKVEIVSARQGG